MTSDDFRKIALRMSDALELGHMDHPDFRVGGRVFATLGYPNEDYGMLNLTPGDQLAVMAARPAVFSPARGAWGRNGSTLVRLSAAQDAFIERTMELAYDTVRMKAAAKRKTKRNGSRT